MSIGKNSIARAAVANCAAKVQSSMTQNLVITKFELDKIGVLASAAIPRQTDLDTLKKSIDKNGVLCPVLVAATPKGDVWLLDGYRRFYAAKALGLLHIDAVVIKTENKTEINRLYKELISTKSVQKTDDIHEEKFRVLAVKDHDLPAYLL